MSCKSSIGCVDSHVVPVVPVRATYVNLYKWPESDAEFVKAVAQKTKRDDHLGTGRTGPAVVDSYSCRQVYLRSYTFSKKETMNEKTMRCLSRVRDKASELPFILKRSESVGSVNSSTFVENKSENKKRNKKNKKCGGMKKLVCSLFRRIILSCNSGVDVVDHGIKSGK
ncbi:hypothetical protein LUZ60_013002 [Juncus effusus]|nr:hypothetical protein LUZ60_013002 [Juncus effusus]